MGGAAKRRGTYEERVTAAIERNVAQADRRAFEERQRKAAMTPDQRKRARTAQINLVGLTALVALYANTDGCQKRGIS